MIPWIAILLSCSVGLRTAWGSVTVSDLRCEYLANPRGIDATEPRLSWTLQSSGRAERQTAYHILVASSEEKLTQNEGDLWDSGRVESDQSTQVRYAGRPLASREACYWKVRVWDQDGQASGWSDPAHWTMGLLNPADWNAQWIGLNQEQGKNYLSDTNWIWFTDEGPETSAPVGQRYFRRDFTLPTDRRIMNVTFRIAADDRCNIFLNGRDIGSRSGPKSSKEMDLTHRVVPGRNVLAVKATNDGSAPNPAGMVSWMRVDFDRGEPLIFVSDGDWKAYDKEVDHWTDADFDDSSWPAAQVVGPVGMEPWGDVQCAEDRRLPARWLRKEFDADKEIRRATISLSGLGLSELYINGNKVGDDVLSPAVSEYPQRVFYVTYDVTEYLRAGKNALGVILGNGRFYSPRSQVYANMQSYGLPKLLLNMQIHYTDGSTAEIVSDESWRLTDEGPIRANNEYDGEEYDARMELGDWSTAGYDDAAWQAAQIMPAPTGEVVAQMIEPIRITDTLQPIAVTEPQPGIFIFDLGQNMVGWCRLKVSGSAGTRVMLRHAETLKPDGTLYLANIRGAKVTDVYTLKGQGTEQWEPRFTYHGFRFVEVTGYPGTPSLEAIEGRVVHDDVRSVGEFACSNPLVNQIYRNVMWGVRGNYRSMPTDCPQRDERQGWLGDRSEESKGESYLFDIAALYGKWLQDIEDSQRPDGSVPDVAPAHWPIYTDNVTWPSSFVLIPNMLHRQYADTEVIARHYDGAKKWVDHMLTYVKDGIIDRDRYGDWCVPPEDPALIHSQDPARKTSAAILATSYFYHDLRLMERYANVLGKTEDAEHYGQLAADMKDAFNAQYYNQEKGYYDNGTQTSCVLPLYFGLVPEDQEQRVFDHLVQKITEETDGHIGTGLIGGQFLNQVLADHGRSDLAYTIASQKDYPSWGYMVSEGATTIWELWNGNTADPAMNSGNHVMLVGDLVTWFYEYLAGIAPDEAEPGFQHIIMRPHPVGDLEFVKASFLSPHGKIASHWQKQGDSFDWQITVPANTVATVYVPASDAAGVTEGGKAAAKAEGVKFLRMEAGRAVFEVGSGDYHFVSE